MPIIPSGNISLLELIDLAFERKHGNATVDPLGVDEALDIGHQWQAVRDAVWKAFKAHDMMLYVESLDGTEKRLTDQKSDDSLVWRTLITGNLEHEHDPAVFQRTVYVRDDDASTFLEEFTGKGLDRPIRQPTSRTKGLAPTEKRGSKPKFAWDDFWREVVRIANTPDGLPETQAHLEKHMQEWCRRNWGDEPSLSTIREKVNKLEKYRGK